MTVDTVAGPLLVIAHEATRTGAPRVLLDVLTRVKPLLPVPLAVRLETGGPLAEDLLALDDGPDLGPPAAVLVNSSLAASAVLEFPDVPAALYVHEDAGGLAVLPAVARDAITTRYDRVLCVSERAARDLADLGVDPERLRVVPPIVSPPEPTDPVQLTDARRLLGADEREMIVLGCGEGAWRKGADLFVALAHVLAHRTDLRFGWVGLRPLPFARHLDHDVELLGIGDRIRWVGEVPQPQAFLEAADLVVVTSRNDPQPLVPVEAALVGTPSVGFAIGGMIEVADAGAAITVPYPDVRALADAVTHVLDHPDLAEDLVAHARARWRQRQSPDVIAPKMLDLITELTTMTPSLPIGATT